MEEKNHFDHVMHTTRKLMLRVYLENDELEKARNLLDKGLDAFECIEEGPIGYRWFAQMSDNRFIEVTKLLNEYGFPIYLFGEKVVNEIGLWEKLSAGKWSWLLKNGMQIPRYIDGFSLMHRMFYKPFSSSNTKEERNELLFWLLETKNIFIFEDDTNIFDLIIEGKEFHFMKTIDIFQDTFDEKTMKEYKKARMIHVVS